MNTISIARAPLSAPAAAVGLAAALVVLFVLCAVVQAIAPAWPATHAWIALFTAAPPLSLRAWVEGVVWSAVFGVIAGTIFVAGYNAVLRRAG
jgi:hypothetical protein